MSGPTPKPAERRQRRNTAVIPFPATRTLAKVPAIPPGLLVTTKTLWKSFWSSDLARIVEPATDLAAIVRVFTLIDERERAFRAYRRQRLVTGSQGQEVLSPMGRFMLQLDAEIRTLEDRLGMTPRARLQLGITFGEAAKSLAELNRMLSEDNHEDDENDQDPRR